MDLDRLNTCVMLDLNHLLRVLYLTSIIALLVLYWTAIQTDVSSFKMIHGHNGVIVMGWQLVGS